MVAPMSPRVCALALLSSLLACSASRAPASNELSPALVMPTTLGEGHGDEDPDFDAIPPRAPAAEGGASAEHGEGGEGGASSGSVAVNGGGATGAVPPPRNDPPDPTPLRLKEQWEYELEMKAGKLSVLATHARTFPQPVVTARRFGRYAIELWIGNELVDRIRFDFPGLAMEEPDAAAGGRRPLYSPITLTSGAEVRQKVLVPAAPRARRARLLDRGTGQSFALPWPPEPTATTPSPPAGAAPPKPVPSR